MIKYFYFSLGSQTFETSPGLYLALKLFNEYETVDEDIPYASIEINFNFKNFWKNLRLRSLFTYNYYETKNIFKHDTEDNIELVEKLQINVGIFCIGNFFNFEYKNHFDDPKNIKPHNAFLGIYPDYIYFVD